MFFSQYCYTVNPAYYKSWWTFLNKNCLQKILNVGKILAIVVRTVVWMNATVTDLL